MQRRGDALLVLGDPALLLSRKSLFERVDKVMRPDAIVSSNTSGLPLKAMSEGRSSAFKKNFVITHFFNPVRYMKLVELVTGPAGGPYPGDSRCHP